MVKNKQGFISFIFLSIVIFTLLIFSYCYISGKNEYKIANEALKLNDFDNAVTHYARSIEWYIPYASYVDDSAKSIIKIAQYYETKGDMDNTKYAYNILRGAILSVRSSYTPKEEYLKICNERLADLGAKSIAAISGNENSFLQEKESLLTLLNEKEKPDTFWAPIAAISFIGWVIAALVFIMQLFKNNVVNLNKSVIIIMVVLAVTYAVWLMSLIKA